MPTFGWLAHDDPRDAKFPMRSVLGSVGRSDLFGRRFYRCGPILDQGDLPHCVGFTVYQWFQSAPTMREPGPGFLPQEIYAEAQERDPWAGEPHNGTTLRAALKFLRECGRIESFVWARNPHEAAAWILEDHGTVWAGTPWTRSMLTPTNREYLTVEPNSPVIGGHAYLLAGYCAQREAFRVVNSWGRRWGGNGRAWLSLQALYTLEQLGRIELVAAVERPLDT